MLTISARGQLMPESPIRKLDSLVRQAHENGIKIHHLNIGQPDIETPEVVLNAVKNSTLKVLPYAKSDGLDSLREKFCTYYKSCNIDVSVDDIIVTAGASEAIYFLMNTIADTGDEIIIPEPFYANYLGFAIAAGVGIRPITQNFEDDFLLPSTKAFEEHITSKTRAILICNPGNPTGKLYLKEDILKLADLARRYGLYLIADEVYREFIYDGHSHYSVMEIEDFEQHAIIIDSVSKRYSMCGARIGCIVTKNEHLKSTFMKFAQARLSTSIYGQIAGEAALGLPDSFYKGVVDEYRHRRDVLIKSLSCISDVRISTPKGAFYCIVKLPVKNTDNFAKWLLESYNYEGETLMIAPASGFYITEGLGYDQARLAYVLNSNDIERAITILKNALNTYRD